MSLFLFSEVGSANLNSVFDPTAVFDTLYRDAFYKAAKDRIIAFEETNDVILRSGLINTTRNHFVGCFEQLIRNAGESSVEIHMSTIKRFQDQWANIQSSATCLICLHRRPQYSFHCKHSICETCVVLFGERSPDDESIFKTRHCFLCGLEMLNEVTVKVHPPTAGVGVLCIDGGGSRGIIPLQILKRIQDRMGLPIPPQKFFKAVFAVSSGKLDGSLISKAGADYRKG